MGDKTQLLSLILAARFRRPLPIIAGLFTATIANHTFAGAVGEWLTRVVGPEILKWVLAASFIAMAAWVLIPDKMDEKPSTTTRYGAYVTTVIAFFLAEMGDKTQIATVALAAKYHALAEVVAGTTLGMLIADVPAVFIGDKLAHRIPLRLTRTVAAAIFLALGVAMALGAP